MILTATLNPETYSNAGEAIARLKRGDPDALTAILAEYQQRLYRFLLRLAQDRALADDLFQQTWLRVMEKIGSYDSRSRFDTWLFAVAHHLAIDHFRRKSSRSQSLDAPDESGVTGSERLRSVAADPLEELLESERAGMLLAAIAELPAIHREVLSLRFEEGMKLEEIAEVAAIPLSTVKSRLTRALDGVRVIVQHRLGKSND